VYFDLAEIRGYEYHTGLVFAAYADGHGLALANGGRYDNIGKVFGSERSATGFNTDIKALIDFLGSRATLAAQPVNAGREIIAAPNSDEASLWSAVSQLRSEGKIVIFNGEAGTETPTSLLVQKSGNWVIEKIK
ncbi:MAG: ATP phosphoribosyltransferase regulatory subunit, partial [Pseudomonadales bacterium]